MARTIDIAVRDAPEQIADAAAFWVDSEQFEALLRDACADASLLRDFDELLPDTIAES